MVRRFVLEGVCDITKEFEVYFGWFEIFIWIRRKELISWNVN